MLGKENKVKIQVSFHSMKAVQLDCRLWASTIKKTFLPEAVIFLEKSGFLFAKPMTEEFACPMYSLSVGRPGNDAKDSIREKVPYVPKFMLALALKSKAMYGYNEDNAERKIEVNDRFDSAKLDAFNRILIVDDSVDTGWSMLAAKELVQSKAPNADVRIASYCVIDYSLDRVKVDFLRRQNAIVMTATSRYSKEYGMFLSELAAWKANPEG